MELNNKPLLLYAEDDLDDFESLEEALRQLTDQFHLVHAKNGMDAIWLLQNDFSKNLPCLIIIDLNMPVMDGKEMLVWIKEKEHYNHIPVMVFTTSSREEDIRLCQTYNCTFFRKPTLYRDLLHVAQTMLDMCNGKGHKE
jgi:CheY-like chemotaxis protein